MQLKKLLSWFGKVSHTMVVMTRSPRVKVDNVVKSVPESGCQ
jgi:hypothetical protein